MEKNYTFYYFKSKNPKFSKKATEKELLKRNFNDILNFLDNFKFSPDKKVIDKILEYARKS